MTSLASILAAVLLAFIGYKLLMGFARVAVILLVVLVFAGLWQQGAIG